MTTHLSRRSVLLAGLPVGAFALTFNSPANAAMYPRALDASSTLESDEAAILVGNAGPQSIDYLQFTHDSFPAINARAINLAAGRAVAVPVPIGTKGLTLSSYTTSNRPGMYFSSGASAGYIAVHTPPINITARGLYYVATVYPERRPNYDTQPNTTMLARFKTSNPKLANGLPPVNFRWPK